MIVSHDLTILSMIVNASIVVKAVMAVLVLASLFSWTYIFMKVFGLRRAHRQAEEFEREFWSGADLVGLYQRAAGGRYVAAGMERIFEAGFKEFLKLKGRAGADVTALMDGTRRAMKATLQREVDALESHLSFLATVGSVSPYIGLFGTVWGIMNAFRGLSNVAQATLAQVAPGIAEALVATAIGLFAAIPAVIAYNRFAHDIDRLAGRYESFMEELSNILQRQAHQPER
ncbi:MAG: protein TolQ [Betaproteobacteria bacterium]|nr:protein TolQ [Betaproteobacteria bacterium]PWB60375.1 MAG: protein TolQ [Betaproteobacteria bacterium]